MQEVKMDEKKMQKLPVFDPDNPSRKIPEKEEKWLREVGSYEFINVEEAGLMHGFTYGNTKCAMKFLFMHGGTYRTTRFIARHINSRSTPMWKWVPDGEGSLRKELKGRKSRFQMREIYS